VLGPDTPALGERKDCAEVTQSQVAATVAALLGEDWKTAEPARPARRSRRPSRAARRAGSAKDR
jgi:hypothetical protein